MVASRVTYNNLFSQGWQNIYDLINNRSNVADPISPTNPSPSRKFVYAREPVMADITYQEHPFIVVSPIKVTNSDNNESLDVKHGEVQFSCTIQVVTCDRGHGRRDAMGAIDNDAISEDIFATLNDASNRKTLRANGLPNFRVKMGEAIPEELHDTLAYRRIITVTSVNKFMRLSA